MTPMYHPTDAGWEYVELYNPTSQALVLSDAGGDWRMDGGIEYAFVDGGTIPAHGRVMVVGFDPILEADTLAAFADLYGVETMTPGVDVFGPWSGDLSNGGERIALERPLAPDLPDTAIPWVIVDEVVYSDRAPWAIEADGAGKSLRRAFSQQDHAGNDPNNWLASNPTPGR